MLFASSSSRFELSFRSDSLPNILLAGNSGAISKTAVGGEIDSRDPGGFGTLVITKSITIEGGGTLSSVLAAGTNGIIINAGANDVVTLLNLSINGAN